MSTLVFDQKFGARKTTEKPKFTQEHLRRDAMKKARASLDNHGVDYAFHDCKSAGIERERLERWAKKAGWETPLSRAGT